MIQFAPDSSTFITSYDNVLHINRALVEETSASDSPVRYYIVSCMTTIPDGTKSVKHLRLNIDDNTIIMNSYGMLLRFEDIQVGAWIEARFSAMMTRSIPPQAQAYLIVTQRNPLPAASLTTTGSVVSIDIDNNLLHTGNPRNAASQTRYTITDNTVITDKYGNPIPLYAIRPEDIVRITHANFQTASIPPQTIAYSIQQL